jgi:hypothetical protein
MTTHTATTTAARVAAGVTAEFVLDLSRRSARAARADRRAAARRPYPATTRFVRARDDCAPRGREAIPASSEDAVRRGG